MEIEDGVSVCVRVGVCVFLTPAVGNYNKFLSAQQRKSHSYINKYEADRVFKISVISLASV